MNGERARQYGGQSDWAHRYRSERELEENKHRAFADAWKDIGRPFFECAYCGKGCYHFTAVEKGKPEPGVPVCTAEKFVRGLVYRFPSLQRQAPGLAPWSPTKWARWWRTSGAQTHGSYHVVAFVLSVWSGGNKEWKRRGYEFDLARALQSLDESHRRVIREWIANPWWP